jgi:hypothetical protein
MHQRIWLFLGMTAALQCNCFHAAQAEEKQSFKIYNQFGVSKSPENKIGPLRPSPTLIIRNAKELAAHCDPTRANDMGFQNKCQKELADILKVSSIDWEKQMVVAVKWNGRDQRGPLPPVFFTKLEREKDKLVVHWTLKGEQGDWIPRPLGVALIEKFEGPVSFQSLGQKKK